MLRIKLRRTRRNQLNVCTKHKENRIKTRHKVESAGLGQAQCTVGNKALDITESEQTTCKTPIPYQTPDLIFQTRKY